MSDATIVCSGLRKRFGPTVALEGLSFTVTPGNVTGLVRPNDAGKTTTLRVILGLDAADQGTALLGGRPYHSLRHPLRHPGSLLDAAALQPSRSGRNHLLWLARSQGLAARRVDQVLAQAGLPSTVQAGLFATSPQYTQVIRSFGLSGSAGGPTQATAAFDHLGRQGTWPSQA